MSLQKGSLLPKVEPLPDPNGEVTEKSEANLIAVVCVGVYP